MAQISYDEVNLMLRLYDLRREERLRQARAWFHGGDAANDGAGEIRCEGYLEFAKLENFPGARAAWESAPQPDRLMGLRVRTGSGAFWTCDSHAVASGRLGRVERSVGLLKKFFHGPVTPLLAHQ